MIKKFYIALFTAMLLSTSFFTESVLAFTDYTMNVGESEYIIFDENLPIQSGAWTTTDYHKVEIVWQNSGGCEIKALASTGTSYVIIRYTYYYYEYVNDYPYLRQGAKDYTVKVNDVLPTGLSITSSKSVIKGNSAALTATITPEGAETVLIWWSSNTSIVTVSSSGTITGQSAGYATVFAQTSNGIQSSCAVKVYNPAPSIQSAQPSNNSNNISINTDITITYDQDIKEDSSYSSISLKDTRTNSNMSINVSISGTSLIVSPQVTLSKDTVYTLSIPSNSITATSGLLVSSYSGNTISFRTVPPAIKMENSSPSDNSTEIDYIVSPSITFNCSAYQGDMFSEIRLVDSSDNSVSGSVSIDERTVQFIPDNKLSVETLYSFIIPVNSIKNYMDAANTEEYIISFTTKGIDGITLVPPVISPSTADIENGQLITITSEDNADIYYTTDGIRASKYSQLYTAPFTLEPGERIVSAIAVLEDICSQVTTVEYNREALDEWNFSMDTTSQTTSGETITGCYANDVKIYGTDMITVGYVKTASDSFAYIARKDKNGSTLWHKTLTTTSTFNAVITCDDGIIAVGSKNSLCYAAKYDFEGNMIWENSFFSSYSYNSYLNEVIIMDSQYVAVGTVSSVNQVSYPAILKFDANGVSSMEKSISPPNSGGYCSFTSVKLASDGIVAVGWMSAYNSINRHAYFYKCGFNGDYMWQNYNNNYDTISQGCVYTDVYVNGDDILAVGYLFGSKYYSSLPRRGLIDRINSATGYIIDDFVLGTTDDNTEILFESIDKLNNNFFVTYTVLSNLWSDSYKDIGMLEIDGSLNLQKYYGFFGGNRTDKATGCDISANGQIAICGYTDAYKFDVGYGEISCNFYSGVDSILMTHLLPEVSYDANGGTDIDIVQIVPAGGVAITDVVPYMDDNTFLGWSTDRWAVSPDYHAGDLFVSDKDEILYAIWQEKTGDSDKDGHITLLDLIEIAQHFNLSSEQEGYDPLQDLDSNGIINMLDLVAISIKLSE